MAITGLVRTDDAVEVTRWIHQAFDEVSVGSSMVTTNLPKPTARLVVASVGIEIAITNLE